MSSCSAGDTASVATPRPTWTRKKTSHMCVPVCATRAATSGSSSTLARITVVLTCTVTPAATSARMAWTVMSKWPAMPRTPSWVAAHAPSRLTDTALTPLRAMPSIMPAVRQRGYRRGQADRHAQRHRVLDEREQIRPEQAIATREHQDRIRSAEACDLLNETAARRLAQFPGGHLRGG